MPNPPKDLNTISSLLQVVQDLRGPDGCPWDKEQTHETLTPYAIEETFEMIAALESGSDADFCDELGDVLFQVVLHSQLAKERNAFSFSDVVQAITEKIVRRHPHVFANLQVSGMDEIFKNWDDIKVAEKKAKLAKTSSNQNDGPSAELSLALKNIFKIVKGLPALQAAGKIGEKTEKYNFDWAHPKQVLKQLKAEIEELEEALDESVSPESFSHVAHEMGDVLFSAAQLARHLKLEPETTLRNANHRFEKRFFKMLEILSAEKLTAKNNDLDLLLSEFTNLDSVKKEDLWTKAKLETD